MTYFVVREAERLKAELKRAKRLGLPATLTIDEWVGILEQYQWNCAYCGRAFELLEHVTSTRMGGGTTAENCVPACRCCNLRKGSAQVKDWLRREQERFEKLHRPYERKPWQPKKPLVTNLAQMCMQMGIHPLDIAVRSEISLTTVVKAKGGKPITTKTARQILVALNGALQESGKPEVSLEDLGLTIADGRVKRDA